MKGPARSSISRLLFLACLPAAPAAPAAHDWPTWRHDAARTASSPLELAPQLHLQWIREYPPASPAWPDQPRMRFDAAYEPVVMGNLIFVPSMTTDTVTALDTRTGAAKWRFFADGPVRFAPTAWEGKVYFVSDDGHLYCLDAQRGTLLWKFRGGPSDRKILGNGRLISMWPARGAPAVEDGTVYFAAGIWPFMGIFLYALDARSSRVVWANDGDGSLYIQQPHRAYAFAGVAPQGQLAVTDGKLLVPCGRSVPAVYDRSTGKLVHYALVQNSKKGGWDVAARGDLYFNGGGAFEMSTGLQIGDVPSPLVLAGETVYHAGKDGGILFFRPPAVEVVERKDKSGKPFKKPRWKKYRAETIETPRFDSLIRAGSRLYAGGRGEVFAVDPATRDIVWKSEVQGTVASLLAADDRLFAVTQEGSIYCFGPERTGTPRIHRREAPRPAPADAWTARARSVLETAGVREGWCIAWGAGGGRLVTELARQSGLHIIVVEPDPKKVESLRRELAGAGLYGERIAVHQGDLSSFNLPPYLATLMVSEDPAAAGIRMSRESAARMFASLRPFGGAACLPVPAGGRGDFGAGIEGAEVRQAGDLIVLRRPDAPPGSGNWTHEHADAANTRCSKDNLKAPLGLLWFGGTSHEGILPRHGHGPQPQVLDGRLFIEGADMIRAVDIYTGRLLWEASLPGIGRFYNNTFHQMGANAAGTNFISTPDGIYAAWGNRCVRLDPATGNKTGEFSLPVPAGGRSPPQWGYINAHDRYLVGGAEPLQEAVRIAASEVGSGDDPDPDDEEMQAIFKKLNALKGINDTFSSSRSLTVMDRHTGKVLWSAAARSGFRHNAVCIGDGRLYAIDRLSGPQIDRMKKRGETPRTAPRLVAFDLKTGRELWSSEGDIFGTWLGYSEEHDILLEAGRRARDTLNDEPRGMRAWKGADGRALWSEAHVGVPIINGRTIYTEGKAYDLLTGKVKKRQHPLTGLSADWIWSRNYGCNTPMASRNLLVFRSGAAGYFDLIADGGTGNFGGFRSGCSNNLVVAGGVLVAPDYTRTCTCSYQNQTSLALVHMPDVEQWTFLGTREINGPIRRVGINLGAPGDRRAEDGTLWLEHPATPGVSPPVAVATVPEQPEWFRRHSSRVEGRLNWVGASGAVGLRSISVTLDKEGAAERPFTVRLCFAEPEAVRAGTRIFSVAIQGRTVLNRLDVAREAGGPLRTLIREFKGIPAGKDIEITLTPETPGSKPILSGVQIVQEGR